MKISQNTVLMKTNEKCSKKTFSISQENAMFIVSQFDSTV